MTTREYDNEKVIFSRGAATTSMFDIGRNFLLFFKNEFIKLGKSKIKVLDVGCGAGAITEALKGMFPGFSFYACDISNEAILEARKTNFGIRFVVGDATRLPFKPETFDVVMMNSVLDHTDNPKKAVSEAYRVLKRGGTFLVTDPVEREITNLHGLLTKYVKGYRKHRKDRLGHNYAFTKKSLYFLIKNGGFEIENISLDWKYFAQIVDVFYYPLLQLLGQNQEFSFGNLARRKPSLKQKLAKYSRMGLYFLQNLESILTKNFPYGFFAYIEARKVESPKKP
jgi:ubiquinone/menaquinone biosynthesis C-methylase UbiE